MCQCMNGYECPECMFPKKPHKHAELIKAWADGAKIQHFAPHLDMWADITAPAWNTSCDYRIKPEVKPDIIEFQYIGYRCVGPQTCVQMGDSNVKLTFDGETGGLKSVEII